MSVALVSLRNLLGSALIALALAGCAPLIADYSLEAYKNATTLKAETQALIDKSNERYSNHASEVDALMTKINAAYEFAAGTPYNQLSARQWDILRDPNRRLVGGYMALWKQRGIIPHTAFRKDQKNQIGEAFDEIICLEANKLSLKPCYVTANGGAAAGPSGSAAKP